jgi:hypothetical protein
MGHRYSPGVSPALGEQMTEMMNRKIDCRGDRGVTERIAHVTSSRREAKPPGWDMAILAASLIVA